MVEKFDAKDAKKGNFNKQMGFRKKSNSERVNKNMGFEFNQTLTTIASIKKQEAWVRQDLSIKKSTWVGRLIWKCVRKIPFVESFFYNINLTASANKLREIKANITNPEYISLFNNAVKNFNQLFPTHAVEAITSTTQPLDHDQQAVIDLLNNNPSSAQLLHSRP